MKASHKKQIMAYLNLLKDKMGLRDWTIEWTDHGEKPDNHYAEMSSIRGTKRGIVWVSEEFKTLSPFKQRHVICHELTHFHLELSAHYLFEKLDTDEYDTYVYLLETGVDALAEVMAPKMPLPKFTFV